MRREGVKIIKALRMEDDKIRKVNFPQLGRL